MIIILNILGQISMNCFDKNCVITFQNCKKELEKLIFTDLSNFGLYEQIY